MENLLLKIPYKFKKSYGGTPDHRPPRMHPGCTVARTLSLKIGLIV
jgi:hypothetical protein